MSGRYRTVALQAVGVAVLAAFVFVAFLRPSEPDDLAGIEAPGGGDGPSVVNPEPDDEKKKKGGKKNGKNQNRPTGGRRNDGPRAGGNGGPVTSGPNAPDWVGTDTPPGGTDTPPGGGDAPPDDQYSDLVSLLMKQVGQPALFKEIDDP